MIRGGHIDITVLGCLKVSAAGDLASWLIPGKMIKGMGGAMDLIANCRKVIVATTHTYKGEPKIVENISDFPLTGKNVADMLVTELAVFEVKNGKLVLTQIAKETTLEEVKEKTAASFTISTPLTYF